MQKRIVTAVFAGLLALALPQAKAVDTIYEGLGGKKVVSKLVDDFVGRVAADNRINHFFMDLAADPLRMARFKANLMDQICAATGGPCKYRGRDMKSAHAGLGITGADFDALVQDLMASLDKFNVKEEDKNTVLNVLGPMKAQIVEK